MKAARRFSVAGLGIALGVFVLLGFYQNCAPQGSIQNQSSSAPADSDDQTVRAMGDANGAVAQPHTITSTAQASKVSLEMCELKNLNCFRKVYSPDIDDANGVETICADQSNPSTCLQVTTHSYNTRVALAACENCKPEDSAVGGEYNREEYTCWLGVPGAPTTTAFALRPTLDEAVRETLALCGAR